MTAARLPLRKPAAPGERPQRFADRRDGRPRAAPWTAPIIIRNGPARKKPPVASPAPPKAMAPTFFCR